jgi:hypothetical protein
LSWFFALLFFMFIFVSFRFHLCLHLDVTKPFDLGSFFCLSSFSAFLCIGSTWEMFNLDSDANLEKGETSHWCSLHVLQCFFFFQLSDVAKVMIIHKKI